MAGGSRCRRDRPHQHSQQCDQNGQPASRLRIRSHTFHHRQAPRLYDLDDWDTSSKYQRPRLPLPAAVPASLPPRSRKTTLPMEVEGSWIIHRQRRFRLCIPGHWDAVIPDPIHKACFGATWMGRDPARHSCESANPRPPSTLVFTRIRYQGRSGTCRTVKYRTVEAEAWKVRRA